MLFELKSLCPDQSLPDPAADYKTAKRAGQYRVSTRAIYFPAFPGNQYLPFSAVSAVAVRDSTLCLTGCCGKELPAVKINFVYGGGQKKDFLMDPPKSAAVVISQLRAGFPQIPVEDSTAEQVAADSL